MATQSQRSKLLIIGGSGFVSGTLAREALAGGWKVWVLTRGQRSLPDGVVGLVADRRDHVAVEKVIEGAKACWDLVVDCIGYEPADVKQDISMFRALAKHLVFISTDFVFDPAHRKFPQSEESIHYATQGYGGNKRLCELELLNNVTGKMAWTILRPCHIYGPGSQLGCLPTHGRDPKLLERLKKGEPLRLAGGGHFLQQPIFARDLAKLTLSVVGSGDSHGNVFCAAGPDIIESREYYRIIAEVVGVELKVEEVPVAQHLAANAEAASFLCHRIYDLGKLKAAGLAVPRMPIQQGLREHVLSLTAS
ncbi:MAG: NAD-dependent epimerase/dehydratase family protein [Verrucomicrobiae bacterium]|nr:NAD-dependent epimerase/dehydratase family protein [Verrucomicrobiae bacterium]